jgi:hypothetical protein
VDDPSEAPTNKGVGRGEQLHAVSGDCLSSSRSPGREAYGPRGDPDERKADEGVGQFGDLRPLCDAACDRREGESEIQRILG